MQDYLDTYGWHFSKKLAIYAVSRMKTRNGEKLNGYNKEQADDLFKRFGIDTSGFIGYDAMYVLNRAKAVFLGSSLKTEEDLAKYVNDSLTDKDGYDEIAMTRYYADCIGKGEQPMWEDML